ncbi:MAG TPA: protein kinase [Pyrinomonadaceae bacterium]
MLTPNTLLQGRYRILRQLGQGGMGTVYEGIDERFESQVAIKETLFRDEGLLRQFEREARLLNKLRHPAMTRVVDHFSESNVQYLVMDFVPGEDLAQLMERQKHPFPLATVIEWGDQLLDALKYLHSQTPPIIHRDIKPHNLKASEQGRVILLDFGLAKGSASQMTSVATAHSVVGYSPAYAPLEQMLKAGHHWMDMLSVNHAEQVASIQNKGTDARSDIYSLGATLLHLLTDKMPPNAPTRALSVWSGRPDPLDALFDRNIPPAVADVLRRAMALSLDERFPSAADMQNALREASRAETSGQTHRAYQQKTEVQLPPPASGVAPTVVVGQSQTQTPIHNQTQQPGGLPSTVVVRQQPWEQNQPAQQPAAQPFGAQAFSSYAPRKSYLPWVIGGGAIVVIAVVIIIIVLTAGSSSKSLSSPSGTVQARFDALKKKDAAGYKRTISKRGLEKLDQMAAQRGITADNLLQQYLASLPAFTGDIKVINEQIAGDSATVLITDGTGQQFQLTLIKEDGEWKFDSF